MTRELLKNYRPARQEIELIDREIREIQDGMKVHDTVQGSCPEFPFTLRTLQVYGLGEDAAKNAEIIAMRERQAKLKADCTEVVEWWQGITDSIVSQAVWLRYLDKKPRTWAQVSTELTGSPWQEEAVRKAVKRKMDKEGII